MSWIHNTGNTIVLFVTRVAFKALEGLLVLKLLATNGDRLGVIDFGTGTYQVLFLYILMIVFSITLCKVDI
jgi:hypothetical protein